MMDTWNHRHTYTHIHCFLYWIVSLREMVLVTVTLQIKVTVNTMCAVSLCPEHLFVCACVFVCHILKLPSCT